MDSWDQSPVATEIEVETIRHLCKLYGYDPAQADGVFTSGGSQSNQTAIILARDWFCNEILKYDVKKYGLRLLLFAFISEIPFDLALTGQLWDTSYSNVFFTLAIALIAIWMLSYVEKFYEFWQEKQRDSFLGILIVAMSGILVIAVCGGFAEIVLKTDYGLAGILAIVAMYVFRKYKEIGFAAGVFALTIFSSSTEILALAMLGPLMRYDGSRGKNIKYLFYAFYPVHLLILALVCIGLGV